MNDAIDLSINIPWTTMEMNGEDKTNDVEKDVKPVEEPSKTLSF